MKVIIKVSPDVFYGGFKVTVQTRARYSQVWHTVKREHSKSLNEANRLARQYRQEYRENGDIIEYNY